MIDKDEDILADLLVRWEELREQGQDVSALELCQDCLHLADELARRIKVLKATLWLDKPLGSGDALLGQVISTPQETLTLVGRYRLDDLIAEGGFAQVWRGFDLELQRVVAVKVPKPSRLESTDAFMAEARRVARLKHPGIVPVHDVGREDGTCFIVSEYVDGGSLGDRLANAPPLHEQAIRWMAEVADALEYAHRHGIIHRDIKPANILLSKDGRVYLADFGIAINEDESILHGKGTVGTLAYMSPEQIESGRVDLTVDIYGLGVVLYELLTGRLPFRGDSPIEVRDAILAGKPKPPSQINDQISERVERMCLKAMARNPADRYSTARAFADDVRSYLQPQSRWRKVALIGGTVVLVLLLWAGHWMWTVQENARMTRHIVEQQIEQQTADVRKKVQSTLTEIEDNYGVPKSKSSGNGEPFPNLSITQSDVDLTGHDLTDADFEKLGRHFFMSRLVLANTPTTDAQLALLRSVPGLEWLDLSGTHISDDGIENIAHLPFPLLHYLSLAHTSVTDLGLTRLGLMRLRELNLADTKITDEGVKHLAERNNVGDYLTDLDLTGTATTDACIPSLALMPSLTRLVVSGTKLTDEGLKLLKMKLPKCQVER